MKIHRNIEAEVFSEMCLYARGISDIAGKDIECMGYLFSGKGRDSITGFYFPEQYASISRASASEFPCMDLYARGKYLAGMWHSHGMHGLFHSHTDHEHIKTRLAEMQRHNKKAGCWDFSCSGSALDLLNRQAMQGVRIAFADEAEYSIKAVREIIPSSFLSIVINAGAYRKGDSSYFAELFTMDEGKVKHVKAKLEFAGSAKQDIQLGKSRLEEIGEKYSFSFDNEREHAVMLKDTDKFKELLQNAPEEADEEPVSPLLETIVNENSVELKSRHGVFVIDFEDSSTASGFASNISSVEGISEEEIAEYIPSAGIMPAQKKLESILSKGKNQESIVPETPYYSNDEYLNGARELHAFYTRVFLMSMEFYKYGNRDYMEADKAMIDIFAALSGVFEDETNYGKRLDKAEECIARLIDTGVQEQMHKDAVAEAMRIISSGGYARHCPEKVKELVEKLKIKAPKREEENANP